MRIQTLMPLAGMAALLIVAGCTTSKPVMLPSAGPNAVAVYEPPGMGTLQVYSARELADNDVNFQEFFANDDLEGNDFPHNPAHSDYSIYGANGKLVRQVHNTRDADDPRPALVELPAGTYSIRAEAKGADPEAFPALIDVTIKAGEITQVFIDGDSHLNASR